jgi:hypothetical protein
MMLSNHILSYNRDAGTGRNCFLRGSEPFNANRVPAPSIPEHGTIWPSPVSVDGHAVKAYEDGVEIGPAWSTGDETGIRFNRIGHDSSMTGGGYFNRLNDEVWVFSYALGSSQVATLYESNTLGLTPTSHIIGLSGFLRHPEMLVYLADRADASKYRPKGRVALDDGSWDAVPHAAAPDGTFAVSNLSCSATEGTNTAIYVKSTNSWNASGSKTSSIRESTLNNAPEWAGA